MNVTLYPSFAALPERALHLLEGAEAQSLYYGRSWFKNYCEHIPSPHEAVRFYVVTDATTGDVAAVAPLVATVGGPAHRPGQLEGLSNYYTSLYGIVAAHDAVQRKAALTALFHAIAAERPRWSSINLRPLDNESQDYHDCIAALKQNGFIVQPYFCFGNWILDLGGRSFDEYFQSLPSQVRNTVQRKEKQLLKKPAVELRIVTDPVDVDHAMDQYEIVYRSSWKEPEPYPGFMRGLVRESAARGWLRLGLVTIEGQPAAAQIWINQSGVASIYKLAYDEKFQQMSVGSVLTKALMRHAIDVDRVTQVDYLTGDDAYKRDWMSRRRERWGLLAMNPKTLRGQILTARYLGGELLKRLRGKRDNPR